ncbi:bifunctional DNA-binding transcriptional regulator/O6-methylguanine-DNA methyltransferase Ada [Parvularcula flava]|uniref:methylated-DNA--[protein]-cysteine S-methyltransferase n=1 Tax=Aquisalinus luteolus TaxID=1566827 RepID=A0A8J3A4R8_9PROT|nr:bifunctional DNA-binding transcriptional regulator/O6-methylguanine-DNA methyltransferase Ada [Aquisalinus luteolus]NHK28685.1 bifunctional DNA-binding transcriptional regulator/O6-methylguanine-DNA methyltransferase Ada [Aquisalinus luteolus]GGH99211.1 AraC family transcriptional regulator [Aquisalinus luteolus]
MFETEDSRWEAVRTRAKAADGHFWLGVTSTGIYCRPGCPARTPKRENVRYFPSPGAARAAGLRPCKRCKPDGEGLPARDSAMVQTICRMIEEAETPPSLADLAAQQALTPGHLSRLFKGQLGITPRQYADAVRDERLKTALQGEGRITDALYDAGFNAPSRAYESAGKRLGMTPGDAKAGGKGQVIRYAMATSWLGRTLVAATEKGLCAVQLGDDDDALVAALAQRFGKAQLEEAEPGSPYRQWIDDALAAIERPEEAASLPLDIQGTAFQEQVWQALRRIPAGQTVTYGELATAIGRPTATRAVAAACGANHIAVIIPCHRVIGKDGSLTGYRWGKERKAKLLKAEKP